jgi:lipid II:glycine glycyltransferase (peptidoglycan interpeptide bridge formation enzyme)
MILEINIHQEREWKSIVQKSLEFDSYHTWEYHNLTKDGIPILLVYQQNNDFVAIPLLKRNIPNSDLYDMTSVYGYTGPISNCNFNDLSHEMKENFRIELNQYLKQNRIVSVFSRLNPFLEQTPIMNAFQGIHDNGNGVMIDLLQPLQKQREKYKSSFLKQILKLKGLGYYIKESKSQKAIKEFSEMYLENMKRIGASDYYLFNEDYFTNFLNSMHSTSKLIMVYHEEIPVSGGIVLFTKNIIQLHLMATKTAFLKYSPSKYLNDEISQIGRQLGIRYFNLGGGLGFKKDSLFDFKSSFSDNFYEYKTWRYISDPDNYEKLLKDVGIEPNIFIDFFPLYRYPNNKKRELEIKELSNSHT